MKNDPPSGPGDSVWRYDRDYARVMIRDLVVERCVGVHPWERHPERPNRLVVNIDLFSTSYGQDDGAGRGALLDYDHIRNAVRGWPALPHTLYLETVVEEVFDLCFADPRVDAARVSVLKPDIFNEAGGAGVEMYRLRPRPAG